MTLDFMMRDAFLKACELFLAGPERTMPHLWETMNRGAIGDKWSKRILWLCAIGSAVGLYMVAVERQLQNRERMLAESLKHADSSTGEEF